MCHNRGCDGERVYWNGMSMIGLNGKIMSRTAQYSIQDVEIALATIDLEDIRAYRYESDSTHTYKDLGSICPT